MRRGQDLIEPLEIAGRLIRFNIGAVKADIIIKQ